MGRAQSDTYSSLFTKSDNVNLDETFDRKSALVHVLRYTLIYRGIKDYPFLNITESELFIAATFHEMHFRLSNDSYRQHI